MRRHVLEPREGLHADAGDSGAVNEGIDLVQHHRPPSRQGRLKTGTAQRLDKSILGVRPKEAAHPCGQTTTANRQEDMIGHLSQLLNDLDRDGGLAFDHIDIIEGRQEMTTLFCAERLSRGEGVIKVVALQFDLDCITAEHPGFLDLLLWRCHRHEDHALHTEVAAHEGHPLRMISSRGTDKQPPFRIGRQNLAHRVERTAQLVGSHRRQIFALEPDVGFEPFRQMRVAQKWCRGKNRAHGAFGCAGLILKLGHSRSLAQLGLPRKPKLRWPGDLALRQKTR